MPLFVVRGRWVKRSLLEIEKVVRGQGTPLPWPELN
jgi:hypothetical protein